MSTRTSLYYWSSEPDQLAFEPEREKDIHIYREMHDGLVHLEITDGTNSMVNFALPPGLAEVLVAHMEPEGRVTNWKENL